MDEIVSKLRNRIMFDRGAFYFFLSLGIPQPLFLFCALFFAWPLLIIGFVLDFGICFLWLEFCDTYDIEDFFRDLFLMVLLNFSFFLLGICILLALYM